MLLQMRKGSLLSVIVRQKHGKRRQKADIRFIDGEGPFIPPSTFTLWAFERNGNEREIRPLAEPETGLVTIKFSANRFPFAVRSEAEAAEIIRGVFATLDRGESPPIVLVSKAIFAEIEGG